MNIERIYFNIDENTARRSKEMMSFSDYKSGSTTAEYKACCDNVYELADRITQERPEEAGRISRLAVSYAKKMAEYYNKDSEIGTRCPSIMISGGSNFPVRKKEKQIAAWDRNREFYNEIQKIREKIETIGHGKNIIKSNDKNAVEKLEKKLQELENTQDRMKAANRAIRLKDIKKGYARLLEMGYTEEQIENLREPDYCGRIGYPDYVLRNNNANIRRIKGRIKNLKETKERGNSDIDHGWYRTEENADDMRVRVFFDGKPSAEVRDVLKKNGFRWAPSVSAWQRQLNTRGRYALERVIEEIDKMEVA